MGSETWYIFYANLRDSSVVISSLFQKKKLLSRTFLQSNLLSTTIRDLIQSKFHFFSSINGRVIFYQLWKHTVKFCCLLLRDILDFWILWRRRDNFRRLFLDFILVWQNLALLLASICIIMIVLKEFLREILNFWGSIFFQTDFSPWRPLRSFPFFKKKSSRDETGMWSLAVGGSVFLSCAQRFRTGFYGGYLTYK